MTEQEPIEAVSAPNDVVTRDTTTVELPAADQPAPPAVAAAPATDERPPEASVLEEPGERPADPPPPPTLHPLEHAEGARLLTVPEGNTLDDVATVEHAKDPSRGLIVERGALPDLVDLRDLPTPPPAADVKMLPEAVCDGRTFAAGRRVWCVRHPMFDGTVEAVVECPLMDGGVACLVKWDEPLWTRPTEPEIEAELSRILEREPGASRDAAAAALRADPVSSVDHPRTLRFSDEPVPQLAWKTGDPCRLLGHPDSDGYVYEVVRRSARRGDVQVRVSWTVKPRNEEQSVGIYCHLELMKCP